MHLDETTRNRLLKVLADHPEHVLITKDLVKVENFRNTQNTRAYAYLLTPQGIEEKARVSILFLQRKQAEYDAPKAEIEAL